MRFGGVRHEAEKVTGAGAEDEEVDDDEGERSAGKSVLKVARPLHLRFVHPIKTPKSCPVDNERAAT